MVEPNDIKDLNYIINTYPQSMQDLMDTIKALEDLEKRAKATNDPIELKVIIDGLVSAQRICLLNIGKRLEKIQKMSELFIKLGVK